MLRFFLPAPEFPDVGIGCADGNGFCCVNGRTAANAYNKVCSKGNSSLNSFAGVLKGRIGPGTAKFLTNQSFFFCGAAHLGQESASHSRTSSVNKEHPFSSVFADAGTGFLLGIPAENHFCRGVVCK